MRSNRFHITIMLLAMLAFLVLCAAPAYAYFEWLQMNAGRVGGGLEGLFPEIHSLQEHPIAWLAGLGMLGILGACSLPWWLERTLRRKK